MLDAFMRWLPVPSYRFEGGPADGQTLVVDLIRAEDGMVPPDYWNLETRPLPPAPLPSDRGPGPMPDLTITRHSYRFVPAGRSINQGHYRYVEDAK